MAVSPRYAFCCIFPDTVSRRWKRIYGIARDRNVRSAVLHEFGTDSADTFHLAQVDGNVERLLPDETLPASVSMAPSSLRSVGQCGFLLGPGSRGLKGLL